MGWQNGMGVMDTEELRLAVYRAFAWTGQAPRVAELAEQCGADVQAVRAGLAELARARHLVLDAGGAIIMAHPFSAVPLGFSVMGARTLWRFAAHWYDGRLDRGYVRREPDQAKEYLRGVGLEGACWGL
jgi:hypothetical protein